MSPSILFSYLSYFIPLTNIDVSSTIYIDTGIGVIHLSKNFDRFTSLAFLIIGIGFIYQSINISKSAYGSNVGPNIFPMGLGLILVLLSLRLLYETFQYKQGDKAKESLDYKRFGIILISAILYALFLENVGYVISTFLFLLIGFQTMEKGKWVSSLLISAVFSFGIYYVYVDILSGTLPGFPTWLGF
jgi:putative tricarboxylic transport membrane protein